MATVQEVLAAAPQTVGETLAWRVRKTPFHEAFRYKDAAERWVSLTWTQTQQQAHELAAGLLTLGLGYEQRVAIAANTRIEWILADYAINCAGGATTTVYPTTQSPDFEHILSHSESQIIIAENPDQLAKVDAAPGLEAIVRHIVLMEGEGDGERVLSWEQLRARGRARLEAEPGCVTAAIARTSGDTLATLIYTSGTTGLPKGVELTHSNWTYEGFAVDTLQIITDDALQYLWLPLSHVFGKCLLACQTAIGFASAVDGRIDRIVDHLGEVKPTFMCGAPRIFEKVRATVLSSTGRTGVKGRIARWAFSVGRKTHPYRLSGDPLPRRLAAQYRLADRLVYSKLKERMGGNIRFFISGSAKLSTQVQSWFFSAGLVIVEGYGLTETSAVATVNEPRIPRLGTVGPPTPGTEVRIADDGEILFKGPGVMRGYHKDPELTAEVLVDGWFHTGDIGELDADGYVRITDRKKDLLKTSGGKYVAPQKVESVVAATIPFISQVVAVGDGRKYIAALLTVDQGLAEKWAARHRLGDLSYSQLITHPEFVASVQSHIDRANAKLERWETVKRFAILDGELTVDSGGVTPNMKVRRAVVVKQYGDVIDSLYEKED
ncbi:AMP-dependent synthetase/ligase [Propionicicella superfundia]|uniref:AMP-dependent synthetase/ligase n=1 Tax=Propionicicella superfundia TaxID=348582 RepID=UPI000403B4D3|nr:long-chain fatty acid--CoA ligase [Propionicicella superfundia]